MAIRTIIIQHESTRIIQHMYLSAICLHMGSNVVFVIYKNMSRCLQRKYAPHEMLRYRTMITIWKSGPNKSTYMVCYKCYVQHKY